MSRIRCAVFTVGRKTARHILANSEKFCKVCGAFNSKSLSQASLAEAAATCHIINMTLLAPVDLNLIPQYFNMIQSRNNELIIYTSQSRTKYAYFSRHDQKQRMDRWKQ
jgi:hypothetical protein